MNRSLTDRTAKDWGRVAVSLPGWRWMAGMLADENAVPGMGLWRGGRMRVLDEDAPAEPRHGCLPVVDDPATEGCFRHMLEYATGWWWIAPHEGRWQVFRWMGTGTEPEPIGSPPFGASKGRAWVAAAEALGGWPVPG